MELSFDPETHTYRVKKTGLVVPSVTQVISPLIDYSMIPQEMLALAAERGDAVHKATWLDDQDDLDESSIDEIVFPYLYAWRRFRREKPEWSIEAGETQVYSVHSSYAGTFDRLFRMNTRSNDLALIEIKTTSSILPATGVQLAGYLSALPPSLKFRVKRRFVVKLQGDGDYRLREFKDRDDFTVFNSLVSVHHWKNNHAN